MDAAREWRVNVTEEPLAWSSLRYKLEDTPELQLSLQSAHYVTPAEMKLYTTILVIAFAYHANAASIIRENAIKGVGASDNLNTILDTNAKDNVIESDSLLDKKLSASAASSDKILVDLKPEVEDTISQDNIKNDDQANTNELRIPVQVVETPLKIIQTKADTVKPSVEVPQNDDDTSNKQSASADSTPRPGLIQQGINSFQQFQQSAIANIQNVIRPNGNLVPVAAYAAGDENQPSNQNVFQQAIQNLQNSFQQSMQNLNQTVTNFFVRPQVQSADPAEAPQNSNLIQQTIQNLQNSFQQGMNRLNQTISNYLNRPQKQGTPTTPEAISQGIQNLQTGFQAGVKNVTHTIQSFWGGKSEGDVTTKDDQASKPADETSNPPAQSANPLNIFQQVFNNFQQGFLDRLQEMNQTFQNFVNQGQNQGQSDESSGSSPPNIFQQGLQTFQQTIQNFGQNFQNFISRPPTQSDQVPQASAGQQTSIFQQGFQNIQQSLQNINQNLQNLINRPQEQASTGEASLPAGQTNEVEGVQNTKPQEDKQKQPQSESTKSDAIEPVEQVEPQTVVQSSSQLAQKVQSMLPQDETARKKWGYGGNGVNDGTSAGSNHDDTGVMDQTQDE